MTTAQPVTTPTATRTTPQNLFDRWVSEAIALKANSPEKDTRLAAGVRSARIKSLLDCAAQLQCVTDLLGTDPRDPGGLEEHFDRIADRAKTGEETTDMVTPTVETAARIPDVKEIFHRTATVEEMAEANRHIGKNRESDGLGSIGRVAALILMWFPSDRVEACSTGRDPQGFLKFNLVVSYGEYENKVLYVRGFNYRDFSEATAARALGHLDCAVESRGKINTKRTRAEKDGLSGATHALHDAMDMIQMHGWNSGSAA